MKRKGIIAVIIFLFLAAVLLNPFAWVLFGSDHLREKVIEEVIYKVLVDKLTHELKSDWGKSKRLFDYVDTHFFNKEIGVTPKSIKDRFLRLLIRGTGYCDELAHLLIKLAKRADIRGRVIYLKGYDEVSHHTVCDLYIDGKFRIFDPDFGYIFTSNNEVATFYDIQNKNNIKAEKLDAQLFFNSSHDVSFYFKLYEPTYEFIVAKTNYNLRIGKILRSYILDLYYIIFGNLLPTYLEDLYFTFSNIDHFAQARIKHLSYRFDEALLGYSGILQGDANYNIRSESLFFMGQLFYDIGEFAKCIATFEEFLQVFPKDNRTHEIYFYLGNSYEGIRSFEKAEFYYSKIKQSHTTPAPTKLRQLMKHVSS